jgi:hypothetical protein
MREAEPFMTEKKGLSDKEIEAQQATDLPDREAMSLLDVVADLNLDLNLAAPIDAGVAANANAGVPIDASVGANVASVGSQALANSPSSSTITQNLQGTAVADSSQTSEITQG